MLRSPAGPALLALVPALILAALAGCESTPTATSAESGAAARSEPGVVAPMDVTGSMPSNWEYLRVKYDADGDGRIVEAEYVRAGGQFDRLDRDGDGAITEDDFRGGGGGGPDPEQMRGMRAQANAGRGEPTDGAMEGVMAPDFTLSPPEGSEAVTLSSFRNNLPVALIFGSYT